jgi:hypothetical protein
MEIGSDRLFLFDGKPNGYAGQEKRHNPEVNPSHYRHP